MEHLTKKDLEDFRLRLLKDLRRELFEELKPLLRPNLTIRKWIKSYEVKKMLNISSNTLQRLREKKKLIYTQVNQTIYYDLEDIQRLIEEGMKKREH